LTELSSNTDCNIFYACGLFYIHQCSPMLVKPDSFAEHRKFHLGHSASCFRPLFRQCLSNNYDFNYNFNPFTLKNILSLLVYVFLHISQRSRYVHQRMLANRRQDLGWDWLGGYRLSLASYIRRAQCSQTACRCCHLRTDIAQSLCCSWITKHHSAAEAFIQFNHKQLISTTSICYGFAVKLIICPIAIAYSMGQIIKSVCVCLSVCQSVCMSASTLTVAFLDQFSPKLAQT